MWNLDITDGIRKKNDFVMIRQILTVMFRTDGTKKMISSEQLPGNSDRVARGLLRLVKKKKETCALVTRET